MKFPIYSYEQMCEMYRDESPACKAAAARKVVVKCLKEYNTLKRHYPNMAKAFRRDAIIFYKSMQFHRSNIGKLL